MGWLFNLPVALWRRLLLIGQGLAALAMARSAPWSDAVGRPAAGLGMVLGSPAGLRHVFALLRHFRMALSAV
jgi:hypothetical protein